MIDEQTVQQVVARIVAEAQPSRVILFGSYGRGDADLRSGHHGDQTTRAQPLRGNDPPAQSRGQQQWIKPKGET